MSWQALHNLNHVDHRFQPVSSRFILPSSVSEVVNWNTNDQYQQSIQMFAFIPELIGAITVVVLLGFTIISACQQKESDRAFREHQSPFSRNCRFFLGLCAFVMLSMAGFAGYQLWITSGTLETTLDNSHQPYTAAISWGRLLDSTLKDVNVQLKDLNTTSFQEAVRSIEITVSNARGQIHKYLNAASVMSWGELQQMDSYRSHGLYGGIGILVYSFVIFVLAACTPPLRHYKNRIWSHTCFAMFNVFIYVVCVSICLIFAVSVEIADGCADPHNVVTQIVNKTHIHPTAKTFQIVDYYTYCDSAHSTNPLVTNIEKARNQLNASAGEVYNLTAMARQYVPYKRQANALEQDFNDTLADLTDLDLVLKCDVWHGYFLTIHNTSCQSFMNALCLFYLMLTAFVALLCLRSWICCSQLPKGLRRRVQRIRTRQQELATAHRRRLEARKQQQQQQQAVASAAVMLPPDHNSVPLLSDELPQPSEKIVEEQNVEVQFDESVDPLAYSRIH